MRKIIITIVVLILIVLLLPKTISIFFKDSGRLLTRSSSGVLRRVGAYINYPFRWLSDINDLRDENIQLKERIAKLSNQSIKLNDLKKENKTLRAELDLHKNYSGFNRVVASVISRSSPSNKDKIIIDQGKRAGINVGDAVISSGYLVGKIKRVFNNSSEVTLITSPESIIQAKLVGSNDKGIVTGKLAGIFLSDLPSKIEIKDNALVETSGLGDLMPQGILIGETTTEKASAQQPDISVRIRSWADFTNLDIVFVLINKK